MNEIAQILRRKINTSLQDYLGVRNDDTIHGAVKCKIMQILYRAKAEGLITGPIPIVDINDHDELNFLIKKQHDLLNQRYPFADPFILDGNSPIDKELFFIGERIRSIQTRNQRRNPTEISIDFKEPNTYSPWMCKDPSHFGAGIEFNTIITSNRTKEEK